VSSPAARASPPLDGARADLFAAAVQALPERLAAAGYPCTGVALISPLGVRKGRRFAFRVETAAARVIKVRLFESAAEARRIFTLRRGLGDGFAPVIALIDDLIVETWVAGEPIESVGGVRWEVEAGALLGRLHATPLPADVAERVPTAQWLEAARSDLALLLEAGHLDGRDREHVLAALADWDPGSARVGLTHRDFCAENMIADAAGRLWVIDNEQLAFDPRGFDLAWTRYRWPLPPPEWAAFVGTYTAASGAAPEAFEFWQIAAGLMLARVIHQRSPARLGSVLALLRSTLANADAPRSGSG
jgi:hypothetical protein